MSDEQETVIPKVSIEEALKLSRGNKSKAAVMAGVSRQTVARWAKTHSQLVPQPTNKKSRRSAEQIRNTEIMRLVTVHLTRRHDRNGHIYGPGTVKVPNHLATDLLATERNAQIEEEKFHGTRGVIIGGRTRQGSHSTRLVPVETFDDSLNSAEPFTTIKVGGS